MQRQIIQPFKFSLSPNYFNNHWNAGLHTCFATCISSITRQIFTGLKNHVSNKTAAENETSILWMIYFSAKSCSFCHYYTKAMLKIQPYFSMMPQHQHWDIFEVRLPKWFPFKHQELLAQWHSVTSNKIWIFSNTLVTTSNLTPTIQ